ncbi:hypothetical protein M199_gp088 [Halogranum tailed virus 1]|uniref:Uncharacterized protein n=1 Tax=Halogranum tailed virus 1 TaxID=1273749 RepID=R4TN00_9CAUD|nr:hypothetical protein M199_gp088 [Halogranum tailed virus 1]AGM11578.1 hypothetical protein HGTV1_281 [Halogranum tailed virus 1]
MDESHTDDVRNIAEGDDVTIETTEGDTLNMTCSDIEKHNADPRTGEVRETTIWHFDLNGEEVVLSRVEGLRSSPSDPEFPVDKTIWHCGLENNLGYAATVQIHGPDVQAEA